MIIDANGKCPFEIRDSTGKEIKEIYDNQDRLLFKNWNEIQGSPPITFRGYGKNLTECRIYGNTVQNGTPSSDVPVDVVGCGVRTEQLFEDKIIRSNIDAAGRLITNPDFDMYIAKVEQGVTYTASSKITGGFYTTKPVLGSVSYNGQRFAYVSATITAPITGYMVFRVNSGSDEPIMLNLGSTALPYEPYGYKIPVTVGGVNLFDASRERLQKVSNSSPTMRYGVLTDILTAGKYTFTYKTDGVQLTYRTVIDGVYSNYIMMDHGKGVIVLPKNGRIFIYNGSENVTFDDLHQTLLQLVAGSNPPDHYEPYNRTTTPVYVGSEPLHKIDGYADYIDFERGVVVRNIKKLILTGKEAITKAASNPVFTTQPSGNTPFRENAVTTLSTHYQAQNNVAGTGNVNDMSVCVRRGYGTMYIGDTRYDNTTDFKSYLVAQYEAGTPVTIWYVLAEPEETPLSDLDPITPLKGTNTLSTNTTIQPSEIYLKGKIKSLATHMLVDSSGNILLTSNNYQLVTKEE